MITIQGPRELFGPYVNGQPNQFFPFITQAATRGVFVTDHGDTSSMSFSDTRDLPVQLLGQIASLPGVSVSGYPVWVAIPEANLGQQLPSVLQQSVEESPKTWAEAHQPGTDMRVINGTAYVAGNFSGVELSGAMIAALMASGFSLLSIDEIRAVFAQDDAAREAVLRSQVPQPAPTPPPTPDVPQETTPTPEPVVDPPAVADAVTEPQAAQEPAPEPVPVPEPAPEPTPEPAVAPVEPAPIEPQPEPAPADPEPTPAAEPTPEPAPAGPAAAAPPEGFTYQDPATGYWYNGATNQWWIPATGEFIAGSPQQ